MSEQADMRPPTLVAQVLAVQAQLEYLRSTASHNGNPGAAREFSIAVTAAEDLVMRINRGMAKVDGAFEVGDYERDHYEQLRIPDPDPDYP